MTLIQTLGLALILSLAGNYALIQRARALDAKVEPLKQAAREATGLLDGLRDELKACQRDKLANDRANDRAIEKAQQAAVEAALRAEEYRKRLANPGSLSPSCSAILEAQVCPELADY